HVAVAAIARRCPCEPFVDQMLTNQRYADSKLRAARSRIGGVPVRAEHQLAVPAIGNLDAVNTAVVLTEVRLRPSERLECGISRQPSLLRACDRCDAWTSHTRGRNGPQS